MIRFILVSLVALPPLLACAVLALAGWSWAWLGVALSVLGWLGGLWVVARQVPAISWVELPEELVIRKGRLFRSLSSVPYGRLQFVDVHSGPLERSFGLASVIVHTASPETGGTVPGLDLPDAEALRERLARRGDSQRAGL